MHILKKLDNWINGCFRDKGWIGIISWTLLGTIGYLSIYWSPEIYSWITGKKINDFVTPSRHRWHMMIANLMYGFGLFANGVQAIRLIKNRKIKKRADDLMEAEF